MHWFDARRALDDAASVLKVESLESRFADVRRAIGPPWNADHKMAMAAAIAAAGASRQS